MFACMTKPNDDKNKKIVEYHLLVLINNTLYNDGLIDEITRDRIVDKLKKDYKIYRSA